MKKYCLSKWWCTFIVIVSLKIFLENYQNMTVIWKRKKNVSEIYSWSRGFVFRQKFMIKYKSVMFASRDILFTLVRKRGVICAVTPILIIPIQVFTRHLNMECFESAIPVIFLSYPPTFFHESFLSKVISVMDTQRQKCFYSIGPTMSVFVA